MGDRRDRISGVLLAGGPARFDRTEECELDALMARLSQGERAAFDPLFRALYPRALRLASARLGTVPAPDVAQSALLKVFARASEFRSGAPALPWFYGIVANEITSVRRQRFTGSGSQSEALPAEVDTSDPEAQLLERELMRALQLAIDELDQRSADAITTVLTGQASASAPAFRKRVSRAYARLRILLRGSHGD